MARIFGWVVWSKHYKRWVRRFRKVSLWVPKKNGKSPLGAAVGLYLLKWDGESGQKVYSVAKDRAQAGIVHGHAQKMVKAMPEGLRQHFDVNHTTGQVRYALADSVYSVLSGENIAGQEGLNGSVIVDETHVVDERTMLALVDMGASRAEPLQFEISTAGNDPMSYGRKQYDYGREVESGERIDEAFFFKSYGAPQDTAESALTATTARKTIDRSVVKILRDANPSWGKTINPDEFLATYSRARRTAVDWAGFKQRRLNIWQAAANPWFAAGVWDACEEEYDVDAMKGLGGGLGLDLSRSRDMTAAVFVARDGDVWRHWPVFWLPEGRIEYLRHRTRIEDWINEGKIRIIPGETIRLDEVEDNIAELIDHIGTELVCFDPRFALEMAEHLEVRCKVSPVIFKQTYAEYGPATDDYERMILAEELKHPGHDILTWQIGNAKIMDYAGCRKPIKDKNADWKTIDGVQAAVMGLKACLLSSLEKKVSMFEEFEPVFV
jgi:phage terminase large subunit-like protein